MHIGLGVGVDQFPVQDHPLLVLAQQQLRTKLGFRSRLAPHIHRRMLFMQAQQLLLARRRPRR